MINRFKLLVLALAFTSLLTEAFAQNNVVVSYRDSNWVVTSQQLATRKVVKEFNGKTYHSKGYNLKENYYIGYGDYLDTGYTKPVGTHVEYYKNGKLKDSSIYGNDSKKIFGHIYYESGKLRASYRLDPYSKNEEEKGFDETGKEIPNYIIEREAAFPGGADGWKAHLIKHMNPRVPVKKKAPRGTYQVVIKFIVDTSGALTDIEAETSLGYGMEEEAIRVLKKSPHWIPAVQYNQPLNAYRRQPVTFVVQ